MNRRDFIGAAIGTLVVALALPFEEFAAWCRRWLRPARGGRLFAVGSEPGVIYYSEPSRVVLRVFEWIDQHGRPHRQYVEVA